MEPSQQPPRLAARQKLLIQLLAFIGLALLLYLKPQVEAWVESRQQNQQTANDKSDSSAENSSTSGSPWKKTVGSESVSEEQRELPQSEQPSDDYTGGQMAAAETGETSEPIEDDTKINAPATSSTSSKASNPPTAEKASAAASEKKTESSRRKSSVTKMDRAQPAQRRVPDDAEKNIPPPAAKDAASTSTLGKLKEIDDNVFESTAGLVYLPGSADGHRLRHVMEHAKDNTSKEIHGVYDGERDEILAVIDEAFTKAKKGGTDVRSEKQNGRRIYTVNLKRRIGQMGGQQGERQGNPECRYLRMVIENDVEVVTAYPTKSF